MYTSEQEVESFLNEYKRSRVIIESTVKAILNRAVSHERKFNKHLYEFNKEEALEMFKSAHAISAISLQNANLTLKHASRWLLDNKNIDGSSVYEEITKSDLSKCVDIQKKANLMLSLDDLKELQNELLNQTDKAILELLFLGVGGKWLKELTYLTLDQVSRQDGAIYFRNGKHIPIDIDTYELIRKACAETELISFGEEARISRVASFGIYKMRANALSENDDPNDEGCMERRFRWVQRRLYLIGKTTGAQLTSGNIQMSGLLHFLKQGVQESGLPFREYLKTQECNDLARRYDLYSELYAQILCDRFEKYFK